MARNKQAVIDALKMKTVANGCTPDEEAAAKAKIAELTGLFEKPAPKPPPAPPPAAGPTEPRAPAFPYRLKFVDVTRADLASVKERFHWRMNVKKPSDVQDILVAHGYNEYIYRDDTAMMDMWSFTIEGSHGKYWIMHFGTSDAYFLHGELEVFQKLFQRPIFPFA